MDFEERMTRAQAFSQRRLDQAKESCDILNGEVARRDDSVVVALGGSHLLSFMREQLMAPPDHDAFETMLESKWCRALENWKWYHRKRPAGKKRHRGDRGRGTERRDRR